MKEPLNEKRKNKRADVLIIGAGIAGLSAGIKLAERFSEKRIIILSKDKPGESNTRYAQGGIAVVMDRLTDTFEQHIRDTFKAGDGLGDLHVIENVVSEGPARLLEVINWGAQFDNKPSGILALGLEGGHSANRIVHTKDKTGFHLVSSMLNKISSLSNVEIIWNNLAIDLLTVNENTNKKCVGATYMSNDSDGINSILASVTILATGGVGQVYPLTTNPKIATGDGIAMAYRAGATIADMQFVQFHPTALNLPQGNDAAFLISEALRGFGAYVCTKDGNRFLFEYDLRGELAPRDSVARAIHKVSLKQPVYIDCRHLSKDSLIQHFPTIYHTCRAKEIDISAQRIPIAPAAHYLCGGIVTDLDAKTSIENLYAIGECARTGLHGANRLASNSLLEALVFAHRCFLDIEKRIPTQTIELVFTVPLYEGVVPSDHLLKAIQEKIKTIISHSGGIIRTHKGLQLGNLQLTDLSRYIESVFENSRPTWLLCETRNLLTVAQLIVQHSLQQHENKGTFYNQDLVEKNNSTLLYNE